MFDIIDALKITLPVRVVFSPKSHDSWDASYTPRFDKWGNLKSHQIKIYRNPDRTRDVNTLIAHELIHAWQEENNKGDIHGKPFQRMARKLARRYPHLTDIYRPELDQ